MIDLERALQELSRAGVQFIIVGGVAATIHGSARTTQDLDIVYARTPENIERLAAGVATPTYFLIARSLRSRGSHTAVFG